ncbi:MAG: ATP-dependent helicase HrpB [Erysipelotrichia bacterium]|nr:ATP-dependent helicase HrpB [Erysipelotrichia bacterium]
MKFPIEDSLPEIKKALGNGSDVILTAEPGAGKSTIVPLALKNESWLGKSRILMLQPRRVAAVAIARRMASLDGSIPGQIIGHSVRFSSNTGRETRIEVLTEGILTRRIQKDPLLENIGLIIFDEFHERSVHADLCLALCREIKREVRPDLRIMVMSATIDTKLVENYLDNAVCITGKGFLYPVDISYRQAAAGRDLFATVASLISDIVAVSDANEEYLVFLPGAGEIKNVQQQLENTKAVSRHKILPLHGSMSIEEQEATLRPSSNPRIILSTNIAETSLTIDGITTVIDSGYCRRQSFDAQTGLEKLELQRISKASATQRAGRAGRLRPGRAIRLWSSSEHEYLADNEEAEIVRIDPTSSVLEVFAWGSHDPHKFGWLQSPGSEKISRAIELLRMLHAIDKNGQITSVGQQICEFPIEPRLARMLLAANNLGVAQEATLAAAIISEKDIILNNFTDKNRSGQNNSPDPDLDLRIELIESSGKNYEVRLDRNILWRIDKMQKQLLGLIKKESKPLPATIDNRRDLLHRSILAAFPDRVCMRRGEPGSTSYTICSGQGLSLSQSGLLKNHEFILALRVDARLRADTNDGRIFLGCAIKQEWLKSGDGAPCRPNREIFFKESTQKVVARERLWYGKLLLADHETPVRTEESAIVTETLLQAAIADLKKAINLDEPANADFVNRVSLLKQNAIGRDFPAIDNEWLLQQIKEMAVHCRSFAELQKQTVEQLYLQQLPWHQREKLEKLVPERFEVPSGSSIKIQYQANGAPILAVKIQELFGMATTPTICNGEQPMLIHLLSPAGRPVQITADLASFWKTGYRQVVGELKGRYPRHPWPDEPDKAIPFKGTKRQLERHLKQ